jgi:DNA polymerase-1
VNGHLVVLDGDNAAHRLHHAVVDRPAAEAFGFALQRYRKRFEPTHMVAVFDPMGDAPSWRRELWPTYKPRQPYDPAIEATLLGSRKQCRFARIALALDDEMEADDLIGAYTEAAVRENMRVTIISGDKDLAQFVRDEPRVRMHDEVRRIEWCPAIVRERFGVEPHRIADLFALIGDSTDGYPGVPHIGPKTAVPLLTQYGSLEQLLANKNLVTSTRTMMLLREHEETARTCYKLASLRSDVALPVPLDGCELKRS